MDFKGFSPSSFEQFIRSLSLKVLGPGVTIFGNGPDGGREASFQGTINFPYPPTDLWTGYGVIQAKFKEKLETTTKDQEWAQKQLTDELIKWATSTKRKAKPEYFIFCTNVELTSANGGGKDTCDQIFSSYAKLNKLKGWALWDANQLLSLVSVESEIRQRFTCFFTAGDLIAEFAKKINHAPNPDGILTSFLCKEIVSDEDARLSQAGDRSEDRIKLADVFVDLRVSSKSQNFPPDDEVSGELIPASMHDLLRASSHKLDPLALWNQSKNKDTEEDVDNRLYGRFVFIGGPGSGKSTIGQFLSQIHRAALLKRRDPYRVEYKVRRIIEEIEKRCHSENLIWPSTPRYPFRIELNAFAKALAAQGEGKVSGLSEYLRKLIGTENLISHEDLRIWLKTFPWLLILDGLDEVPASSNRSEVINAIQIFLNEARDVEADLMVVASSRPDGYGGEFDYEEVNQCYLLPFSKIRALDCAKRYITAKAATKGSRHAEEAMTTIVEAIDNPLIEKLMRSPLQVTFMVTVVAASGKPSESRWQLFNDYYRTIYERELHKAVRPFDRILNARRQDIDSLHHRVGFLLQCRGESSGGTQADIEFSEFETLVTKCLEENGLGFEELEKEKTLILDAAKLRLVFLTSRSPGKLSFDVRSLQEYMAAASITNADSNDKVIERLDTLAHSAYWRNVFIFSVGRFFVEPQMRSCRDKVRILCADLNKKNQDFEIIKLGSCLALEILESGSIGNVPLVSRNLAECSLNLLSSPSAGWRDFAARLAIVYSDCMQNEFLSALEPWIHQNFTPKAKAAWILLINLEKRGIKWAEELVEANWVKNPKNAAEVWWGWYYSGRRKVREKKTLDIRDQKRLATIISKLPPSSLRHTTFTDNNGDPLIKGGWLELITSHLFLTKSSELRLVAGSVQTNSNVNFKCIGSYLTNDEYITLNTLSNEPDAHTEWKIFFKLLDFLILPSLQNLSLFLKLVASNLTDFHHHQWKLLQPPWIVKLFLDGAENQSALNKIADDIEQGNFGTVESWQAKEKKWLEKGISMDELASDFLKNGVSLANSFEPAYNFEYVSPEKARKDIDIFLNLLSPKNPLPLQRILANLVVDNMPYIDKHLRYQYFSPSLMEAKLLSTRLDLGDLDVEIDLAIFNAAQSEWADFFNTLGKATNLQLRRMPRPSNKADDLTDSLIKLFIEDTNRIGLLNVCSVWCSSGKCISIDTLNGYHPAISDELLLNMTIVRLSRVSLEYRDVEKLALAIPNILAATKEPREAINKLLKAIENHIHRNPNLEYFLISIGGLIPSDDRNLLTQYQNIKHSIIESRSSGFTREKLHDLDLFTA